MPGGSLLSPYLREWGEQAIQLLWVQQQGPAHDLALGKLWCLSQQAWHVLEVHILGDVTAQWRSRSSVSWGPPWNPILPAVSTSWRKPWASHKDSVWSCSSRKEGWLDLCPHSFGIGAGCPGSQVGSRVTGGAEEAGQTECCYVGEASSTVS